MARKKTKRRDSKLLVWGLLIALLLGGFVSYYRYEMNSVEEFLMSKVKGLVLLYADQVVGSEEIDGYIAGAIMYSAAPGAELEIETMLVNNNEEGKKAHISLDPEACQAENSVCFDYNIMDSGYFPDFPLNYELEPGEVVPLDLRLKIPEDAEEGLYAARIRSTNLSDVSKQRVDEKFAVNIVSAVDQLVIVDVREEPLVYEYERSYTEPEEVREVLQRLYLRRGFAFAFFLLAIVFLHKAFKKN